VKPRNCQECGAEFTPAYGDKRRAFCGKPCSKRYFRRIRRSRERARERAAKVEPVNPRTVFERDGYRCQLCGYKTLKSKRGSYHPKAPELDHIVPLGQGGEHSYRNTQCACRACNMAKSDGAGGQLLLIGEHA
jgi:5-methylcytosine-specific restriction endonuclease McrA